jgi:hypothetical protein
MIQIQVTLYQFDDDDDGLIDEDDLLSQGKG